MADIEDHARNGASLARAERLFGRVGLAACALSFVVGVLAVDVTLTRLLGGSRNGMALFETNLVTSDGRRVGGTSRGIELVLAPGTLYANRPGWASPGVSINSQGLRGAEPAPVAQRPRVLVVGGSAAFGLDVADDDTLAVRLGALRPGWEVLNGGVIGYLAQQELAAVVQRWIDLEPDVIVAFDGWNDAYDRYRWALERDTRPHAGVNSKSFRVMEDRLADFWRVRTDPRFALTEFARSVVRGSTLLSPLAGQRTAPELPAAGDDGVWLEPAVLHYVENLRKLRDFGGVRGARLLVAVQPERSQGLSRAERAVLDTWQRDFILGDRYHESFPESYGRFRSRARADLERHGIAVLDVSAALPVGERGIELFLDPVHPSPVGHAAIARLLAPRLERLLGRESRP